MKLLTTEQQTELQELLARLSDSNSDLYMEEKAELKYWANWMKPKRTRKAKQNPLDTEEGVIEQAYKEHTGGI